MRSFTAPSLLDALEGTVAWKAFVEGTPTELHGQIVRRWLKHYYGRERVGSTYRTQDIGVRQWAACAKGLGLDPDAVIARARLLAEQIPDRMRDIEQRAVTEGLDATVVGRLAALLHDHVQRCKTALQAQA